MTYIWERRSFLEPIEFRASGTKITATGTAIRYDSVSKREIAPGVVEEIRSGAAKRTIEHGGQLALHEHKPDLYLGRTSNGTLRLAESERGVDYEIDLPDTTVGRDVANLLERGDIRGASFGFNAVKSSVKWTQTDAGLALRSVGELRLHHIATTADPVYDTSTAELAMRSFAAENDVDIADVRAAAEHGSVASLLDPVETSSDVPPEPDTTPAEGTVVHRRPAIWFV